MSTMAEIERAGVTWFVFGGCLYCPACALDAAGGRLLPGGAGDPDRALARTAGARDTVRPDGDADRVLRRLAWETDPHAGCGEAAALLSDGWAACCVSRCAGCGRPDEGECVPMAAYRAKARQMYAHMAGFYRGVSFAAGPDGGGEAALLAAGGGQVPGTGFDDRFPSTRRDFEEGFREGAGYALARAGQIGPGDVDESVITGAAESVAYSECGHLGRWEAVARSESAARALGFATADQVVREWRAG